MQKHGRRPIEIVSDFLLPVHDNIASLKWMSCRVAVLAGSESAKATHGGVPAFSVTALRRFNMHDGVLGTFSSAAGVFGALSARTCHGAPKEALSENGRV